MNDCDYNCMKKNDRIQSISSCYPILNEFFKNTSFNVSTLLWSKEQTEPTVLLMLGIVGFLIIFILPTNLFLIIGIVKTNKKLSIVNKLYIFWSTMDILCLGHLSYLVYHMIKVHMLEVVDCNNNVYSLISFAFFSGKTTLCFGSSSCHLCGICHSEYHSNFCCILDRI